MNLGCVGSLGFIESSKSKENDKKRKRWTHILVLTESVFGAESVMALQHLLSVLPFFLIISKVLQKRENHLK